MSFEKWLKQQNDIFYKRQLEGDSRSSEIAKEMGEPYFGAIGGSISNHYIVNSSGFGKHIVKHATESTYELGESDIPKHLHKDFFSVAKPDHTYEIITVSTRIGMIFIVKDLTTDEEYNFTDM